MAFSARANRLALRSAGRTRSPAELTSQIVAAFVSHNQTPSGEITALMASVQSSLLSLSAAPAAAAVATPSKPLVPAVPIRKSVTDEYIICLEDGRKFKSMKRHLRTLGLTPDQYRVRWGLDSDYPMVAPAYSARRTQLAKDSGLGLRGEPAPAPTPVETPAALTNRIAETFVDGNTGIVCLEDGRVVKDLGRHLRRHFDQSADEYRAKYNLPALYPMKVERIGRFLAGQE